jgi:hypothetical protein
LLNARSPYRSGAAIAADQGKKEAALVTAEEKADYRRLATIAPTSNAMASVRLPGQARQ